MWFLLCRLQLFTNILYSVLSVLTTLWPKGFLVVSVCCSVVSESVWTCLSLVWRRLLLWSWCKSGPFYSFGISFPHLCLYFQDLAISCCSYITCVLLSYACCCWFWHIPCLFTLDLLLYLQGRIYCPIFCLIHPTCKAFLWIVYMGYWIFQFRLHFSLSLLSPY